MAKQTQTAAAPQTGSAVVLTPPTIARHRESSIPSALVESMAGQIDAGYVSNGLVYKTKNDASNAALNHRKAMARFLEMDSAKPLKSRVWEATGKTDPDAEGQWVFGITRRPQNESAQDES